MKKILKWLIRFLLWIFSGFGLFEKEVEFVGGCDYLHPFAPYSFGGIKRKNFLLLLKKQKQGEVIGHQIIELNIYGSLWAEINNQKSLEVSNRRKFIYQYFLSPWKKNYNWK